MSTTEETLRNELGLLQACIIRLNSPHPNSSPPRSPRRRHPIPIHPFRSTPFPQTPLDYLLPSHTHATMHPTARKKKCKTSPRKLPALPSTYTMHARPHAGQRSSLRTHGSLAFDFHRRAGPSPRPRSDVLLPNCTGSLTRGSLAVRGLALRSAGRCVRVRSETLVARRRQRMRWVELWQEGGEPGEYGAGEGLRERGG